MRRKKLPSATSNGIPFTPEKVRALLCDEVLKANAVRPTTSQIRSLSESLTLLRDVAAARAIAIQEDSDKRQKIEWAVGILVELLPDHRKHYERIPQSMDYWATHGTRAIEGFDLLAAAAGARADLAALDALVLAVQGAVDRGLPHRDILLAVGPPTETWMDIAQSLDTMFNDALGGQPRKATYRFIRSVVPDITGENPTFLAIETAFKRNRFVNRGTSVH
jgi:hypothetical protein